MKSLFPTLSWLHNESSKVFEIIIFEFKLLFSLFSSFSENNILRGSCFSSFRRRNFESLFCRTGMNLSPYMFTVKIIFLNLQLIRWNIFWNIDCGIYLVLLVIVFFWMNNLKVDFHFE